MWMTHIQMLGVTWGHCEKGEGRIIGAIEVKDTIREWPTESSEQDIMGLTETEPTIREPA